MFYLKNTRKTLIAQGMELLADLRLEEASLGFCSLVLAACWQWDPCTHSGILHRFFVVVVVFLYCFNSLCVIGLNLGIQLMLEKNRNTVKYHSKSVVFCQCYFRGHGQAKRGMQTPESSASSISHFYSEGKAC